MYIGLQDHLLKSVCLLPFLSMTQNKLRSHRFYFNVLGFIYSCLCCCFFVVVVVVIAIEILYFAFILPFAFTHTMCALALARLQIQQRVKCFTTGNSFATKNGNFFRFLSLSLSHSPCLSSVLFNIIIL